jgi:hypothetical protein
MLRGWVHPRAVVRLEGLGLLKKIQWPHREFNPRTFRDPVKVAEPQSRVTCSNKCHNYNNASATRQRPQNAHCITDVYISFQYRLKLFRVLMAICCCSRWTPAAPHVLFFKCRLNLSRHSEISSALSHSITVPRNGHAAHEKWAQKLWGEATGETQYHMEAN